MSSNVIFNLVREFGCGESSLMTFCTVSGVDWFRLRWFLPSFKIAVIRKFLGWVWVENWPGLNSIPTGAEDANKFRMAWVFRKKGEIVGVAEGSAHSYLNLRRPV